MYDVALSVLACLRANTDVHVAWLIESSNGSSSDAVAITPGGGRIGALLEGAIDDEIVRALPSLGPLGGVIDVTVGPAASLLTGLQQGHTIRVGVAPGTAVPEPVWEALAARSPATFAFRLDGTDFDQFVDLDGDVTAAEGDEWVICSLDPTPRALIIGGGPIAASLEEAFQLIGWNPILASGPGDATGIAPTLAPLDAVVVMGHDVESSGRSLQAAIGSRAGYIGSIGSTSMQDMRREWLAYRGVAWDPRIHGPAGLPIGATTPGEIALSIVAEAVASAHLDIARED